METYVKVSLWIGVVGLIVRLFLISIVEFPVKKTQSLGSFVAEIIEKLLWIFWAGILLWGGK